MTCLCQFCFLFLLQLILKLRVPVTVGAYNDVITSLTMNSWDSLIAQSCRLLLSSVLSVGAVLPLRFPWSNYVFVSPVSNKLRKANR